MLLPVDNRFVTRIRLFTNSRQRPMKSRKIDSMTPSVKREPLLSDPKRLLLDLALQQSVTVLLELIVTRFIDSCGSASAEGNNSRMQPLREPL